MIKTILLIFIIGCVSSCSSDHNKEVIEQNVTLSNLENYTYDLGSFGDEEGAGIKTQARHFEISKLERDFDNGQIIYKYKPTSEYIGTDYIEITTERGSDGASSNTEITTVKITFNITQ